VRLLAEGETAVAEHHGAGDDHGQGERLAGQVQGPGPDVLAEQEHPEQAGRQRIEDGEPGLGGGQRSRCQRLRGPRLRERRDRRDPAGRRGDGLRVVHVPVDDLGIDVAALDASGAQVVVVTPAHQLPTGGVLTPGRRHALVDWASRNGAFIVEDDYDSEFRYDREPVGVLQGLALDRVFAIGTASKALAPQALAGAVAAGKLISDRGSSTLDQLALAALIRSGRYDRHLRRMRVIYGRRRTRLIAGLARHAPGVRLTGLAAGFHAIADLPAAADEQSVTAAARERLVGLHGISEYRAAGTAEPPQLVMGFGNVGERAIEPGIAAVADLLG
jgi:GntR family transcriptional regulator / MocR family aminotransferase